MNKSDARRIRNDILRKSALHKKTNIFPKEKATKLNEKISGGGNFITKPLPPIPQNSEFSSPKQYKPLPQIPQNSMTYSILNKCINPSSELNQYIKNLPVHIECCWQEYNEIANALSKMKNGMIGKYTRNELQNNFNFVKQQYLIIYSQVAEFVKKYNNETKFPAKLGIIRYYMRIITETYILVGWKIINALSPEIAGLIFGTPQIPNILNNIKYQKSKSCENLNMPLHCITMLPTQNFIRIKLPLVELYRCVYSNSPNSTSLIAYLQSTINSIEAAILCSNNMQHLIENAVLCSGIICKENLCRKTAGSFSRNSVSRKTGSKCSPRNINKFEKFHQFRDENWYRIIGKNMYIDILKQLNN